MIFKRPHHRSIAQILSLLNNTVLKKHACYFAGGTAMALRYGEYRESVDMDFLVSDQTGYRSLRQSLKRDGFKAIAEEGALEQLHVHEIRTDQYGLRTKIQIGDDLIKFEIVNEGRIELCEPEKENVICGVTVLNELDMATSKLLANSDRWLDRGVFSRDIIDLGMMSPPTLLLKNAVGKAECAYGDSILEDLEKAIDHMQNNRGWLERCMEALAMDIPKAVVWKNIRSLRKVLNIK